MNDDKKSNSPASAANFASRNVKFSPRAQSESDVGLVDLPKHVKRTRSQHDRSQGSGLTGILMILALALTAAFMCNLILLRVCIKRADEDDKTLGANRKNTCQTFDCTQAASYVGNGIDHSVNPCVDFYQYACGGRIKEYYLPHHPAVINEFEKLQHKINQEFEDILMEPITGADQESTKKVKTFFASCMDYDKITETGAQPMKTLLTELGGWPLIERDWSESSFDLLTLSRRLNELGHISLFGLTTVGGEKNKLIILPEETFLRKNEIFNLARNSAFFQAYETLITDLAKLLNPVDESTLTADIRALVDIEIELTKMADPTSLLKVLPSMPLKELHSKFSSIINWQDYVQSLMSSQEVGIKSITEDDMIMVPTRYLEALKNIQSRTSKKTLANYMLWSFVFRYYHEASFGIMYQQPLNTFMKTLRLRTMEKARNYYCLEIIQGKLTLSSGQMFVKYHFDNNVKHAVSEMIKELKEAFAHLLNEADWMDDHTKKAAKEKIEAMKTIAGYYEDYGDDRLVNIFMERFRFERENFFLNYVIVNKEEYLNRLRMYTSAESVIENFSKSPMTINAYNIPIANEIFIPAGFLQPPFYGKNYPMAMNYGGIGVIVGHEMTHGFDNIGHTYNKNGDAGNWWTDHTVQSFNTRAQCFISQYDQVSPKGSKQKVNGNLTLEDNIADNGGLRQAFRAYRNWVRIEKKEERILPTLNFTGNQLFFLSFAQSFCEKSVTEYKDDEIHLNVHSPKQLRVNGALQNMKEFSETFQCPVSSPMNPVEKCQLW